MITLITPTRNRSKAFALLETYIARQTYKGDLQWIVVNDGEEEYKYNLKQTVIIRSKANDSPNVHSICYNYAAAIPFIKGDKILCIEDDDFYRSDYIQFMSDALETADLVGTAPAYYFHIMARRWRNLKNTDHCSTAQTGFNAGVLPLFKQCCDIKDNPYIDMIIYPHARTTGLTVSILPNDFKKPIHVGIKGLPFGVPGIGLGHCPKSGCRDLGQLKKWIGWDWLNYYKADNSLVM